MRRPLSSLMLATAVLAASAAGVVADAQAASQLPHVSEGDGRVHGGPVAPVSEQTLQPGQVHTLTLHPRYHTVLEFPFPVARIDAGDPEVFAAAIVGNKVTLKATKLAKTETSMSLILGDADFTVVPFIVRADSTQPTSYVIRYTDPVAQHLNAAETAIAERLESEQDRRVGELSEVRLQQRLLLAGDLVRIAKSAAVGRDGERITLRIETAQQLPGEDGRPRVYIRYRIVNQTVAPLADLRFALQVERSERRWIFFTRTTTRDVFDVQDIRTTTTIPAGSAAAGLLVLEQNPVTGRRERLHITALAFNEQRKVRVESALVGR